MNQRPGMLYIFEDYLIIMQNLIYKTQSILDTIKINE